MNWNIRLVALRALPVLLAIMVIGAVLLVVARGQEAQITQVAQVAQAAGGFCLRDAADFDQGNVCTANDVSISRFDLVSGPSTCIPGEPIEVVLSARLQGTAQNRYDIGLYLAQDGGNALDRGTVCFRDYLHPVSADNSDLDLTGGFGPFYNAETDLYPADPDNPTEGDDLCADIQQGTESIYVLNEGQPITIVCQDSDGDGQADVGAVVSWDIQVAAGCLDERHTIPNQTSKCRADNIPIAGLEVPQTATIELVKDLRPGGDPGLFDLLLDGLVKAADVGNGGTTGPIAVTAGTSLNPGATHTISETAGSLTDLGDYDISIACIDEAGATVAATIGPGPLDVPVLPEQAILCTFRNERKQGTILFEKVVVGGSAQPSDWSFTVDGQTVGHGRSLDLYIGSYPVSEDGGPQNNRFYELTGAGGACSLNTGLSLIVTEAGGTCTITNTLRTGSIVIQKATLPPAATVPFPFVSNTEPMTFTLGDGDSQPFLDLPPGVTYAFTETVPAGWVLSDVICSGQTETIVTYGKVGVSLTLAPSEQITCTFQDGALPVIELVKTVKPDTVQEPGGRVTYKVAITNKSLAGQPLTLTALTDDPYGDLTYGANPAISETTCALAIIQPGDTYQCSFKALVEGEPGDVITDTAEVTARDPYQNVATARDDALVTIVAKPPPTGAAFPAPLLLGGLAALGAAMLTAGNWMRRQIG
jgi:hypothetical protein